MTTYLECSDCGTPATRTQEMTRDTTCNQCGGRLVGTGEDREEREPEEEEREEEDG